MGFLELRWISAPWALLLSIVTYSSFVQAGNVVHLTVDWKEPPPVVVQNELLRRLNARSYIQEGMYNNLSLGAYGAYMANVTIGTRAQSVSLVIENSWSDTVVLASTAYECNQKSWTNGDGPCIGGTFDPSKSLIFLTTIPNGLDTNQGDGNPDGNMVRLVGDYFTDSFGIGGTQLRDLQMGLALDSANSTIYYGILGLGRAVNEDVIVPDKTPYPNLMDQLVSQSLISTRAYSFYLNDLNSTTGSVVFGGIDTTKFSGTLGVLPSPNDFVNMSRIAILDGQGTTWLQINTTEAEETNLTATFETSSSLTWVPESVLENVISYFGAVDDRNNSGLVFVDCQKSTTEAGAIFEFTFGRPIGPTINVPMSEMILPLNYILEPQAASVSLIDLVGGIPFCILGNTFLRSAYAVFNLDHNQTALAQAVYGVTDSSIVEISASATGIPALSGVAASSTSTPGSGSTNGGGTSGSNSKSWGISGGTIAGIVIGVLILIGVVGMVAFMGIQKRRAARREPETEDPTRTPKAKTHEVPGKDHEIKKEVATQDNKSELPEDEISKSNVRGITAKSYEVQENELLPQNNKAELPEDRHGIGEIVLHRKLETSAQYNQHELSGSSEHPVEAPSATYSPAHAELDSYGAISPDQFEAAALPELPAEPMQRKPLPAQSSVSRISGVSIPDSQLHGAPGSEAGRAGSSDMGNVTGGPSKVDILQERFERFRAEKERLAKTGELEEMETALQQEIMTELRKEHGSDGRLS